MKQLRIAITARKTTVRPDSELYFITSVSHYVPFLTHLVGTRTYSRLHEHLLHHVNKLEKLILPSWIALKYNKTSMCFIL